MKQETEKQNISPSPHASPNSISKLVCSSGGWSACLPGQTERITGQLKIFKSSANFTTDGAHLIIETITLNKQKKKDQ